MDYELRQRFSVGGFDLAWDEWGSGSGAPLVLLHGFGGSAYDFATQLEPLAASRRVLALEHRGHARSSKSGDENSYTIDHIVDDLAAWLPTVVDEPIHLLGHSMGGRVAMRFEFIRRDLIRSLTLANTTAWKFGLADPDALKMMLAFFRSIGPDTAMGAPESDETPLLLAANSPQLLARRRAVNDSFDPMACKALGLALFDDGLQPIDHLLGDIDAPVLVIAGEHDHPYVDHAADLAGAVSNGSLVTIAGAFHSPQLTHGREWLTTVLAHLDAAD